MKSILAVHAGFHSLHALQATKCTEYQEPLLSNLQQLRDMVLLSQANIQHPVLFAQETI